VSEPLRRGDGVGLELTTDVLRGVRLDADEPGHLAAATEVTIRSLIDDRSVLDSLIRVRAELGSPRLPTRLAMFLGSAMLHRLDVTGRSGPELNALRGELESTRGIRSTVLVDDGPRRWLMAVRWDERDVRRLEELAERAGYVDVAIDPSPLALARVLPTGVTVVCRDTSFGDAFEMVVDGQVPILAGSVDAVGHRSPDVVFGRGEISIGWFDDLTEPSDLMVEMQRTVDSLSLRNHREMAAGDDHAVFVGNAEYPRYPAHDLRAAERQCVALGAAVGAAGLAGRLRPVDVQLPALTVTADVERPWAVERVSELPVRDEPRRPHALSRFVARSLPRRSRR
jgi:hypothetical protein